MKGPTFRGDFTSKYFLNAPKCSSSAHSLCLMNSNANTVGVKKAGNFYGSPVNPYTLITVNSLCKNQSHVLPSKEDCNMTLMSSNTLGKKSSKIILYTLAMIVFTNLNMLIYFGRSEEKIVDRNCSSDTFQHNNMFNK